MYFTLLRQVILFGNVNDHCHPLNMYIIAAIPLSSVTLLKCFSND